MTRTGYNQELAEKDRKRDEALTKIAMEFENWPEPRDVEEKATKQEESELERSGYFFFVFRHPGKKDGVFARIEHGVLSESNYNQKRAELINKPSWRDAPKWARWLAQDGDGDWYWHLSGVVINDRESEWIPVNLAGAEWHGPIKGKIPAGHDWRETLEERPDECEPTAEEDEAFNAMAAMAEQPHVTDARRLDAMLAEDVGKYSVCATLDERGRRYGDFSEGAAIMQSLKSEAHGTPGWQHLNYAQREAVDMILHKIGRVLNGDPDYADNWHDIAGYAQLVERTLTK